MAINTELNAALSNVICEASQNTTSSDGYSRPFCHNEVKSNVVDKIVHELIGFGQTCMNRKGFETIGYVSEKTAKDFLRDNSKTLAGFQVVSPTTCVPRANLEAPEIKRAGFSLDLTETIFTGAGAKSPFDRVMTNVGGYMSAGGLAAFAYGLATDVALVSIGGLVTVGVGLLSLAILVLKNDHSGDGWSGY